jgi:hypothetical protein
MRFLNLFFILLLVNSAYAQNTEYVKLAQYINSTDFCFKRYSGEEDCLKIKNRKIQLNTQFKYPDIFEYTTLEMIFSEKCSIKDFDKILLEIEGSVLKEIPKEFSNNLKHKVKSKPKSKSLEMILYPPFIYKNVKVFSLSLTNKYMAEEWLIYFMFRKREIQKHEIIIMSKPVILDD